MMTATGEYALPGFEWQRGPARSRWAVIAAAVLVAAIIAGTAVSHEVRASSAFDDDRLDPVSGVHTSFHVRSSHAGHFRAEVLDAASSIRDGEHRWVVRLATRSGRRVAHAQVRAVVSRAEDESSVPEIPAVQYVGNGRYEISGLRFDHAGWWNVALAVSYRGWTDSLAFNLIVP